MSKILVFANHYNTLRIFRRELLMKLSKEGHNILVFMPETDKQNKELIESYGCKVLPIKIERRGMNPIKDIRLFLDYLKILDKYKPDKVITYTIKCNIYGAMSCKIRHVPCYVNITGLGSSFQGQGFTRKLVSIMYKYSLNKAEKIFFENVGNRDVLVESGIVKKEKTVVMAGAGVNLNEFQLTPYPEKNEEIRFLFVGRIMQEKGVDELFEAIKMIKKKYQDIVFEFIGWYEDDYKGIVEELQEKGYIRFYGFQPNVKPYIEKAHCIILPSWHEGMSNTLLEGASMGRPLITSNIHGCLEAVEHGKTGFLAKVKDSEDLLEQMEQFIKLPYDEKKNMGIAGRKRMELLFDKNDVVERTIQELY